MVFSSRTTEFIQFLETNISTNIPKITMNHKSTNIFSLLFKHISDANQVWKTIELDYDIKPYNENIIDIHFYPDIIQNVIVNMDKMICKTTFNINKRTYYIHIICEKKHNCTITYFKRLIKRMYIWLYVASTYANNECSQILNIYIHFTKQEKTLPIEKGLIIEQINVNTAYTYACATDNELHIYRKEEWFKVFIHETMHSLGLDFAMMDTTNSNAYILEIFPVLSDVRISETYSEMWAELINILFIVYNEKSSTKTLINETLKMIKNEQKMSLFQCSKILNYYDLKYTELYDKNENISLKRTEKYKEKTHVLSYYIIKSILMFYINDFLNWCSEINDNYSINFNKCREKVDENIRSFCDLIKRLHNKQEYIENIGNVMKLFHNIQLDQRKKTYCIHKRKNYTRRNKKRCNIKPFIFSSLRMSLYEVE